MAAPGRVSPLCLKTPDLTQALSLDRGTLAYWERTGLISPQVPGIPGRAAIWGPEEIKRLALIKRLKAMKCSLQAVRKVLGEAERLGFRCKRVIFAVRRDPEGGVRDVVVLSPGMRVSTLASPGQLEADLVLREVPVASVVKDAERKCRAVLEEEAA